MEMLILCSVVSHVVGRVVRLSVAITSLGTVLRHNGHVLIWQFREVFGSRVVS
jgi:hypothetical protein